MLKLLGNSGRTPNRREILRAGGAGLLGLSLDQVLRAEEIRTDGNARAKSVIFLFLFGGPSQLETFDLKPNAPANIRGPFKPVASRTPGLLIGEYLPKLAAVSDRFSVIRTMTHPYNDHSGAGHYLQTGKRWHIAIGGGFDATPRDWPSMGSAIDYCLRHASPETARDLPNYMVLPARLGHLEQAGQYKRPGEYAGWLGRAWNPVSTLVNKRDVKDNPYWRDCTDAELTFPIAGLETPKELTLDRSRGRQSLLEQFDAQRRIVQGKHVTDFDRIRARALDLATSEMTRRALDITKEPPGLRDRYGRHLFGQSCLLARRLVEAGVRFATVHYDAVDGYSWDSHLHSDDVKKHLLPTFDQAAAALLTDLDDRGLLKDTLVIAIGEMGRTPQANANWGRGHWSTLFPALIGGGGVRGGSLYGTSDKDAAYPIDQPVTPEDLAATIYHAMGIDPETRVPDGQGRPTALVEGGTVLDRLFG